MRGLHQPESAPAVAEQRGSPGGKCWDTIEPMVEVTAPQSFKADVGELRSGEGDSREVGVGMGSQGHAPC